MFIELNRVFYDKSISGYMTDKICIKGTSIISVTSAVEYMGGYWCRKVTLDNNEIIFTTDSYQYIVDKMNAVVSLLYKEGEDNDWK